MLPGHRTARGSVGHLPSGRAQCRELKKYTRGETLGVELPPLSLSPSPSLCLFVPLQRTFSFRFLPLFRFGQGAKPDWAKPPNGCGTNGAGLSAVAVGSAKGYCKMHTRTHHSTPKPLAWGGSPSKPTVC